MKRCFKFYLPILAAFVLSPSGYASDGGIIALMSKYIEGISNVIPSTNMGIATLGKIFGSSPSSYLTGSATPLTALLFQYFNVGVISVVGTMLAYTSVQAIVSTAGEGSIMGQKMQGSYYYVFLRLFYGTTALFPVVGGYSVLQVLLISTIIQGSIFADVVWSNILKTTRTAGSQIYSSFFVSPGMPQELYPFLRDPGQAGAARQNASTHNANIESAFTSSISLYNSLLCYKLQSDSQADLSKNIEEYKANKNGISLGNCGEITSDAPVEPTANYVSNIWAIVENNYASVYRGLVKDEAAIESIYTTLASISSNFVQGAEAMQISEGIKNSESNNACDEPNNIWGWMNAGAHYSDLICVNRPNAGIKISKVSVSPAPLLNTIENRPAGIDNYSLENKTGENAKPYVVNSMVNVSRATGTPFQNDIRSKIGSVINKYFGTDEDKSIGYYMYNPNATEETNGVDDRFKTIYAPKVDADPFSAAFKPLGSYKPINDTFQFLIQNSMYTWQSIFVDNVYELVRNPIGQLSKFGQSLVEFSAVFFEVLVRDVFRLAIDSSFTTFFQGLATWIAGALVQSLGAYLAKWGGNETAACFSPWWFPAVLCIPIFGFPVNMVIGAIVGVVGAVMGVVGAVMVAVGPAFFFTMFNIALQNKLAYVSLAFAVAAPIMALGGSIAFYIPYVPILVYTLATISWLFSVIEAMVAAPIVLLGVTFPKGHDLMGAAQQGFMLFFGVFIRPALIVVGFIFSILVTSISVMLASVIFGQMVLDVMGNISDSTVVNVILVGAVMIVYAVGMMNVIDYSFSFVYRLPVSVMKWIGLPTTEAFEEQLMQDIKGGTSSSFKEVGEGFGGMASGLSGKAGSVQKQGATKQSIDKDTKGGATAAQKQTTGFS